MKYLFLVLLLVGCTQKGDSPEKIHNLQLNCVGTNTGNEYIVYCKAFEASYTTGKQISPETCFAREVRPLREFQINCELFNYLWKNEP